MHEASESRRGHIVFLAGVEGSGRSHLLSALPPALSGARVITGAFQGGRYVAVDTAVDRSIPSDVEALVTGAVAVGSGLLGPAGKLVEQLVKSSLAAYRVLERMQREGRRLEIPDLLPRVLRTAAAEAPVVCLVDDADAAASTWWLDLVIAFAQEIGEELPLVLVMAVDGPEDVTAAAEPEPPSLVVARRLVGRGLATWLPLRHMTTAEISAWLGPMSPALLHSAAELSAGVHGELAELWVNWKDGRVIELDDAGCWQLAGPVARSLTEATSALSARLVALVGDDPGAVDDARAVLACAALEGRTFTADAVAAALETDRDELIDRLDDALAPLIVEAGGISITTDAGVVRHAWRYRFASALDWRIARSRLAGRDEREALAGALAGALSALYADQAYRIAPTLAGLFRLAGDHEAAAHFRSLARFGAGQAVLRSQARSLLDTETDGWGSWELSRAAELLLTAAVAVIATDPFEETLRFVVRAEALSRRAGTRGETAKALYYRGWIEGSLRRHEDAEGHLLESLALNRELGVRGGEAAVLHELAILELKLSRTAEARTHCEQSLSIARAIGDRVTEARSLQLLASIEHAAGRNAAARALVEESLAVHRAIGDQRGEAGNLQQLATIEDTLGRIAEARELLERSLILHRELGSRIGEASNLETLATLEHRVGRNDRARALNERALELHRAIGDREGEASSLQRLAGIERHLGRNPEALALSERALAIRRDIRDRHGEGASLLQLATIEHGFGRPAEAHAHADQALVIYRELGEPHGEAQCLHQLAMIDHQAGHVDEARAFCEQALAINRRTGDREGEAAGLHQLALFEHHFGRYAEARVLAESALAINREIGERDGEGGNLQKLADIEYSLGHYDEARAFCQQSLDITREIGNRQGEAVNLTQLALIEIGLGRPDAAREPLERALAINREIGAAAAEASNLQMLAELAPEP